MSIYLTDKREVFRLMHDVHTNIQPTLLALKRIHANDGKLPSQSHGAHIRSILVESIRLLTEQMGSGNIDADKVLGEWEKSPPPSLLQFSSPEEASPEVSVVLSGLRNVLQQRHKQAGDNRPPGAAKGA